jgi:cell division protein FtsW
MGVFGMAIVIQNKTYILNRFIAFLNPEKIDPLRTGFHIRQALIAVGSGGFWGEGFGNSRQKFGYLPEAQGDSIFPVMAEELGFLRVIMVLAAFFVLAWRGFRVAESAPCKYGKLVATGIVTWIGFQAFINMAVNLSLMPTTGVPLPFVSQGGSALVSLIIGVAILLNISRYTHETSTRRRRNWRSYYPRAGRSKRTTRRIGYRYG